MKDLEVMANKIKYSTLKLNWKQAKKSTLYEPTAGGMYMTTMPVFAFVYMGFIFVCIYFGIALKCEHVFMF